MAFDVQGARKAGYSDAEIADHLARSQRFDAGAARQNGYSDEDIIGHLSNPQPRQPQRQAQPERKRGVIENVTGFMANVNRGLGIGDEIAAVGNAGVNFLRGRTGDLKANMAAQREYEDDFDRAKPKTAALARGTGNALTAVVPGGGSAQAFAQAPRTINALRGATVAGLTGAGYAAADRGTVEERGRAAAETARNPVVLATGGALGALGPARRSQPKPVDPNVRLLAEEGVKMTPGQMRGGMAKSMEDAATSLPIVGPAIQDARKQGLEGFNRATLSRALKSIGEDLPPGIATGSDAVKYVGDKLSAAYKDLIPNGRIQPDPKFAARVRKIGPIAETMDAKGQQKLTEILAARVTEPSKADGGVLGGRRYQQMQQGLDYEIAGYKKSADPEHQKMADALGIVKEALTDLAFRNDPKFAAAKQRLDRGWAELVRIERAAGSSAAEGGMFTPTQYKASVAASEQKVGGRNRRMARGEALNNDLAEAGKSILPSKVPDSGTATRGFVGMLASAPGAVIGGATGGGVGAAAGMAATAAGLGAASRAYSPRAIEAANASLNRRLGAEAQEAALAELAELASRQPEVRKLYQDVLARLPRTGGIVAQDGQSRGRPAR